MDFNLSSENNFDTTQNIININLFVEITYFNEINDINKLEKLEKFHIWNLDYVKMRFNYNPKKPLYLMLMRAYRLNDPIKIHNKSEWSGCKSWIQIDLKDKALDNYFPNDSSQNFEYLKSFSKPCIDDNTFNSISEEVRSIIEMKYRNLGNSGIKVSEIGFGTWTLGLDWWGKKLEEDESIKMLKHAYDLGINFFETADMYGKGKSEKILSKAFKDMRNEVIYSTKWGYDMYGVEQIGHNEIPQKHNIDFLSFALTESMKRLETDFIDVYSLHNPKMNAMKNDLLFDELDDLVRIWKN